MKTKLTKELIDRMAECIAKGHYVNRACALCGISESTFYNWMREAREHQDDTDNICVQFYHAIREAEAKDQDKMLDAVNEAVYDHKQWPAAFRKMESRYPDEWAKHEVIHHRENTEAIASIKDLLLKLKEPDTPEELEEIRQLTEGK